MRERRRPDNRGGEFWGGTREGSGPERDTKPRGVPGGRPGGAGRPPRPAATASYRLGLLSAQQSGRPGPSRGTSRGTSRAASPGLRHRFQLRLRPGSAGEGAGAGQTGTSQTGRATGRAGGSRSEPSSPLRACCHRRRCHRRPAETRRRSPATSAARDAPEAGLGAPGTREGWARAAQPIGGAPWEAGFAAFGRQLAGGAVVSDSGEESWGALWQ